MEYKKALKIALGLALFGALFYIAEPSEIFRHLESTDLGLYLAGAALFLSTYVPATLRWRNLSRNIGYDLGLADSFRVIAVSYGFNKLFPGNSGDVVRSKIFERYRDVDSHGSILGIVALERFLDALSVTAMLGFSLLFVASHYFNQVKWILLPFAGLISVLGLMLLLNEKAVKKVTRAAPDRIRGFLNDIMSGYRSCSRRDIGLNLLYSLSIWITEAVAFYLFILSLDTGLGFWVGALVTSSMSLVSALPISPGGLGAVDAAGTGMLVFAGLNYSTAFSLVVLQRSVGLVMIAAIGAAVYLSETAYSSLESS